MKHLKYTLIKGLITLLPLVITFYFIYWLIVGTESAVEKIITAILPSSFYIPGLGLVFVLLLTYFVGLIANVWLGEKIFSLGESLLERVPLVKTIYGSIKDLLNYFDVSDDNKLNKPVLVTFDNLDFKMLGFVTQDVQEKLPSSLRESSDRFVAVYLPMSYQVGGFMVFVAEDSLSPLDMSIEEAMQYAITAGVASNKKSKG